jgi:hypothetical protein
MATWNSLPPEIHDMILSFVCKDLIAKYTPFYPNDIRRCNWRTSDPKFPKTPLSLRRFSSLVRTCRHFYCSITGLKINGESVIEKLQSLQKSKCEQMLQVFNDRYRTSISDATVGVFIKMAGWFWKNPKICEDFELVFGILRTLEKENLIVLIPHLEEWMMKHAVETPLAYKYKYIKHDLHVHGGNREILSPVVFQPGSLMGPTNGGGGWAFSIKGLYKGSEFQERNDPLRPKAEAESRQRKENEEIMSVCPVLAELDKSFHEWWFIYVSQSHSLVLVDYSDKRIWGNMSKQKLCLWDDVWNLRSWKVEGEDGLRNWFLPYQYYL